MVSFSMALAALTVSSASAQQLIFIPTTTTHEHQQMPPSFLGSGYNNEPPCRTRRLEPWRQQVREHCRLDAATNCRSIEKEEEHRATKSQHQNSFEDEINSFFDSIFSPPPPSTSQQQQQMKNNIEDPFDSLVRSMLGFSLNMAEEAAAQQTPSQIFGTAVDTEGRDEVNEEGLDNYPYAEDVDMGEENYPNVEEVGDLDQFDEGFEEVGEAKLFTTQEDKEVSSTDSESAASEDAAVSAMATMDALVANLAHRSIHRAAELEEEGAGAQEDITSNLPKMLFDIGNNIPAETTHSRRRLMEVGEGRGKVDPHLQVKERLGRRLTEYRQDLFLHPSDGTVTLYTSGLMSSPPAFMTIRRQHQEKIVASLRMGLGDDVDQCMESRFNNGDLVDDCNDAVHRFFLAVNDRSLIPPYRDKRYMFPEPRQQQFFVLNYPIFTSTSEAEMNHFKCMLFWAPTLLLLLLLVMGKVCGGSNNDDEDEEERDVSFDYSKMPEDSMENSVFPAKGIP